MFKSYKMELKLVRSFSLGFAIMSPRLNGFALNIYLGCFHVTLWSRGSLLFGMRSYWNG